MAYRVFHRSISAKNIPADLISAAKIPQSTEVTPQKPDNILNDNLLFYANVGIGFDPTPTFIIEPIQKEIVFFVALMNSHRAVDSRRAKEYLGNRRRNRTINSSFFLVMTLLF